MRLRVVPLAVLVAVVVAAIALRVTRRDVPSRAASSAEATAASVTPSASSLVPLAGTGAVPSGSPRMLHGVPTHVHRSSARGPREIKLGWKANVGGAVTSQVVTSPDGATLYASTLAGSLVALNRKDGSQRWSTSLSGRVYSTPFVTDDGVIWVGSDAKKLFTLDASGKILSQLETTGEVDTAPVPGPNGTVVVAAGKDVMAVRRGGDIAWRFSAKNKIFSSPAITNGLVVVGSQDDNVYALRDGALAWSTSLGADVDASPAIADDGSIFIGTDNAEVVHLDTSGKILWRTNVGGFVRGTLSVARNGDVLAGTYGPVPHVVRIAPDGTHRGSFAIKGTGAKEFGIHGAPLEDAAGTLYFGAQDDAVYALGDTQLFRFETKADVDGPLTLLDDGSLVVPSEDGTVTLLLP